MLQGTEPATAVVFVVLIALAAYQAWWQRRRGRSTVTIVEHEPSTLSQDED